MSFHDPGTDDPLSLHGVVPPTVTAFHDDESVNYGTTADHVRFVVDRGVHAVFPLGTNGEFPLLTGEERTGVVECVVDEIGCSGLVSAVANVFPELVVDCYEAQDEDDEGRDRELQSRIFDVRNAFKTGGAYMSGVKTALRMREFDAGPLRSPLRLADGESAATMREQLECLELV